LQKASDIYKAPASDWIAALAAAGAADACAIRYFTDADFSQLRLQLR
jgi:hypothetical protein